MKILAFSAAREVFGFSELELESTSTESPAQILARVKPGWVCPKGWRVALDENYTSLDTPVGNASELAILPPVSGG